VAGDPVNGTDRKGLELDCTDDDCDESDDDSGIGGGGTVNITNSQVTGTTYTCQNGAATCDPSQQVLTAEGPSGAPDTTTVSDSTDPTTTLTAQLGLFLQNQFGGTYPIQAPLLPSQVLCSGGAFVFGGLEGKVGPIKGEVTGLVGYDSSTGGYHGGILGGGVGTVVVGGEWTRDWNNWNAGGRNGHFTPIVFAGPNPAHNTGNGGGIGSLGAGGFYSPGTGSFGGYVNGTAFGGGVYGTLCP
jgi:hypothetical protein